MIVCHGLASNKSNQLILSRGFVPYGYNVLIFDFRGFGEREIERCREVLRISLGQFRKDLFGQTVIAAIKRLKDTKEDLTKPVQ